MQTVDTIIIGNGLTAKCVISRLNKIGLSDILSIASDDKAPACSTRTTAINCLRGTVKGMSPLGDLIVDSYQDFKNFFNENSPLGVCQTQEWQCWPQDSSSHSKWIKRFKNYQEDSQFPFLKKNLNHVLNFVRSEAFIFSPEIFYAWIDQYNHFKHTEDFVTEIVKVENGYQLKTLNNIDYFCRRLILCTSYMTPHFAHLVKEEKLKRELQHSKPVTGTYLRFKREDFKSEELSFQESFSFVIDEIHFIYRKQSQDILLGATTTNDSLVLYPDKEGMLDQYSRFSTYCEGAITLPSFDKAELITGIRHKGQRRTPYWGEINENCFAVWGLYKNAFTMAFTAAKDLVALIQK